MPVVQPSLWDFALAYYAEPQVAEACVQLQDQYAVNVCLLISLRWLDAREQALSEVDAEKLSAYIQTWAQEIVEPLRDVRRRLKSPLGHFVQDETQAQLRNLVKQAELLAEKKLLMEIERWLSDVVTLKCEPSPKNIARYLAQLKAPKDLIDLVQAQSH